MEQVDPYHLQKAERELRIGFWYAMDMLLSRMMKGDSKKAKETARCLVNDFPAHEYSIYTKDAQHLLNLNIKKIADLSIWSKELAPLYDKVSSKDYYVEYGTIATSANISKNKKQ